jgi:threonine dehydrogenase-like Zn-dependent dehydrogenase
LFLNHRAKKAPRLSGRRAQDHGSGKRLAIRGAPPQHCRNISCSRRTFALGHVPHLVELVRTGAIDPTQILTKIEPLSDIIKAYKAFDQRQAGWVKVELKPAA